MSTVTQADQATPGSVPASGLTARPGLGDRGFRWLALGSGLLVLVILVLIAVSTTQQAASWFTTEGDYAYEEMGLDPDDFDVVYAYSWPDEEAVVADLFDRYAGPGAVLVSYHGGTDFRLRRKMPRRRRR